MLKEKIKKVMSVLMITAVIAGVSIPAYATSMWDYGTLIVGWDEKQVYSNYWHDSLEHRSSVSIGGVYSSSPWMPANTTSYASLVGKWFDTGYANYDYKDQ